MNTPRVTLTPRRVVLGATLLVAVTAGGFAIADDSGAEPRRAAAEAPAPPEESDRPDTPEAPVGQEAPPAPLPDGRHFGRIPGAYVAPDEMVFDAQELIPGDTEDGAYTIRDISGEHVSLPVADDVAVTVVTCESFCTEGSPSTYDSLTLSVRPTDAFYVTVRGGVVVAIDQVYLP